MGCSTSLCHAALVELWLQHKRSFLFFSDVKFFRHMQKFAKGYITSLHEHIFSYGDMHEIDS